MRTSASWSAVLLIIGFAAAAGCGRQPAAGPADPRAAGSPRVYLPPRLADNQGVIFGERQGGTVVATRADGQPLELRDGTQVEIRALHEAEMGSEDASTAEIVVDGETGVVPMVRLLREAALVRSPQGRFAVFAQIESCGDLCHSQIYFVLADGRRLLLGDGVADLVVAWGPGESEVAVGSGQLWRAALSAPMPSDPQVRTIAELTAPAYAPDGTLYARDHDGSVYTLDQADKPARVWKAPPVPDDPDDYGADDPPPVTFDPAGKPVFAPPP